MEYEIFDMVEIERKFEKSRNKPENDGKFNKPARGVGHRHLEIQDSEDSNG